jgi:hypothetical protein
VDHESGRNERPAQALLSGMTAAETPHCKICGGDVVAAEVTNDGEAIRLCAVHLAATDRQTAADILDKLVMKRVSKGILFLICCLAICGLWIGQLWALAVAAVVMIIGLTAGWWKTGDG